MTELSISKENPLNSESRSSENKSSTIPNSEKSPYYSQKAKEMARLGGIVLLSGLVGLSLMAIRNNLLPGINISQPGTPAKFAFAYGMVSTTAETIKSSIRKERKNALVILRNGLISAAMMYFLLQQ